MDRHPPRWAGPADPDVATPGSTRHCRSWTSPASSYTPDGIGAVAGGTLPGDGPRLLAAVQPLPPQRLGSAAFLAAHGVRQPYMGGAMAGGIASADMVIALAREGYLASYGAAGLLPETVEKALNRFGAEIRGCRTRVNLIHSPSEAGWSGTAVELFLRHGVRWSRRPPSWT